MMSHRRERLVDSYNESHQLIKQQTRKTVKPTTYKPGYEPGAVLILLAGRFRGKRVVLLKTLEEGTLLVTGPFKVNGVPLRRVNQGYTILTSTKIDISGIDKSTLDKVTKSDYWVREKKSKSEKSEEAFFKQGEKPEVSILVQEERVKLTKRQAKKPTSARASDQKSVDKSLLAAIKKEDMLAAYLASSWSLSHGQRPHEMKF